MPYDGRNDEATAAAGSLEVEERDDASTSVVNEPDSRTASLDSTQDSDVRTPPESDDRNESIEENDTNMEECNGQNGPSLLDTSHIVDGDDDKLDIVSVLSGTIEGDNDNADQLQGDEFSGGLFGKNLSKIFDSAEEMDRHLNNSVAASTALAPSIRETANNASKLPSRGGSDCRPPLAPSRPVINNVLPPRNASLGPDASTSNAAEDKRLKVFLRVRPPCAKGKQIDEGSLSTIEVISSKTAKSLPSTIRTYPPLNSNAAKVVRCGNTLASSDPSLKKALSSKSLVAANDDGSSDSGTDCTEVRGVKEYSYSGVFGPNSTQSDVYDSVAAPLVEGLFPQNEEGDELGESALLFTLGVTNAGKTHTVLGSGFGKRKGKDKNKATPNILSPDKQWGIIPRSLHHMLSRLNSLNEQSESGPKLQMYMSYLEIYNEQIYDLLPDKTVQQTPRYPGDGPTALKLRESRRGRIFVRGLARHPVSNVQQGLELAQEAKNNRHTASNNINANSSRSHSICQLEIVHIQGQPGKKVGNPEVEDSECETDDDSVCSKRSSVSKKNTKRKSTILWLCDLAGSERSRRTGVMSHTRHQKEAALINASLMNLMRCLREMLNHQPNKRGVLSSKGGVVPFRESKLTHMFMNHLTGPAASRTSMIVNVNPAADDYDETQHVLSYAATARNVQISAVDYNRKRRVLAQESKMLRESPVKKKARTSPAKKLANIVKKLSPTRKRKGTIEYKPESKRLRSIDNTASTGNGTSFVRKALPMPKPSKATKSSKSRNEEMEQLREENFALQITVDDLRQQLVDCEAEIREEVVDMMKEQLYDSKQWYEERIANLKQQINSLKNAHAKQAQLDAQKYADDLLERVNECEEEMQRMRTDHEAELEESEMAQLRLVNQHEAELDKIMKGHKVELRAEKEKNKQLEQEVGALRHQSEELRVSHEAILSKYNDLLASQKDSEDKVKENPVEPTPDSDKENLKINTDDTEMKSPSSLKKLPRDRCSEVASTTSTAVETEASPKKKKGGWFMKSPKVGTIVGKIAPASQSKTRSPPFEKIDINAN